MIFLLDTDIQGVIFDVDDTLWSSQAVHFRALQYACEQFGCVAPSWEIYADRSIRQGCKIWDVLIQEQGLPKNLVVQIRHAKDEAFVQRFGPTVSLREGAESFIDMLRSAGIRIALATSGRTATVECFLRHAWRGPYPDVVVCHDDVFRTKPDPLIYMTVAKRLGIDPARLLAIEDSPAGIESAQGAGMRCIGILSKVFSKHDLANADAVVGSFAEIKLSNQA